MAAATRTARDFCSVCGWPIHGPRCDACGEFPAPLGLEDSKRRFVPRGHLALDPVGLEKATEAFRRGDYPRALAACLGTETNLTVRAVNLPEGPGWALIGKATSVFVSLDTTSMHLVAESPVARLPQRARVPAMRYALELCDEEAMSSRLCLRDDLLVLRVVTQLGAAAPPLVRHMVREMLATSERYAEIFMASFDARPAAAGDGRSSGGWESLGRKRTLATLQGAPPRRSVLPPPPSTQRPPETNLSADDDMPPILAPSLATHATHAGDGAQGAFDDDLPPVLAPKLAEPARENPLDMRTPPDRSPQTARLGGIASLLGTAVSPDRDPPPETARLGAIPPLGAPLPFPSPAPRRRTVPGMMAVMPDAATRPPAPEIEPPDIMSRRPTARLTTRELDTPTDKLCELLHQAQALATALSFEERPATMLLLVRAAVYRALQEFGESLPDAVAYLFRATTPMTRSIWPTIVGAGKRPSSSMPMAEPALLAMERIVAARAQLPKERPPTLEPLSTAQQAREHLARYVEEIEAAPADLVLRHFLALGALSELLARTRLPGQTSQRLKDIIAHALRDGAKPASLDLMMTALKRIVAG